MMLKAGDRVKHKYPFLSDGEVVKVVEGAFIGPAYIVKLDEKAPNTYAWNTDEILCFAEDIEKVVNDDA
jgi:hypothetical protein